MALKRKKGYSIASKTARFTMLRDGIDLDETKAAFNDLVSFYFAVVCTHPEGTCKTDEYYKVYEGLTVGENAQYPISFDAPQLFRRAAIKKAIGAYKSWKTNFDKWESRSPKHRKHRPPVQPRSFNFNPVFYAGMWKKDTGSSIMLKIRRDNAWIWVKFQYQGYDFGDGWSKASPTVTLKGGKAYLDFSVEKYVSATGGLKTVIDSPDLRICSIDLDLDGNIATCSILESDDNGVVHEISRMTVTGHAAHVSRRKRDLGRIARRMSQTGKVDKGFASTRFAKISRLERSEGFRISNEIIEFAHRHGCKVIVFEHLGNLRPLRGKYSRRSNQKRAYWLKDKIVDNVRRIAYQRYAILTARVNPKNTSRLCAVNGVEVWRGNHYLPTLLEFCEPYQYGGKCFSTVLGQRGNSGLNAARNIGLKFLARRFGQPTLAVQRKVSNVEKAKPVKVGFDEVASKVQLLLYPNLIKGKV
ncbi:MAG: transposase [Stigonema ocellatum SAG 48.90 = DSM 106950]|nr:transposase [Stigonema ocellatum SAG 48.90 = DSM 106950]